MSSCDQPTNSCDQRPVGSPPLGNTCSPCAEPPAPETTGAQLAVALAKICELETRINNWTILLQRERNRTAALERQVSVRQSAPTRVDLSSACGGSEGDYVDALAGCKDGAQTSLKLQECQVPMMTEEGITGVELNATWLPAKVQLRTGSYSNTTYTFNISGNNPPKCAKWAHVQIVFAVNTSSTAGVFTSQLFSINPNNVEMEIMRLTLPQNQSDAVSGSLRVPIINGEIKFRAVVGANHTSRSLSINLLGFE